MSGWNFAFVCLFRGLAWNDQGGGTAFLSMMRSLFLSATAFNPFKKNAESGKTSMDWFHGFKLYAIINSKGELIRPRFVSVDDRKPVPSLLKHIRQSVINFVVNLGCMSSQLFAPSWTWKSIFCTENARSYAGRFASTLTLSCITRLGTIGAQIGMLVRLLLSIDWVIHIT